MADQGTKPKKPPNWLKIRSEYEAGGTTYSKLALKYSIPLPTIKSRAKRESWVQAASRIQAAIIPKVRDALVAKAVNNALSSIDRLDQILDEIAQALSNTPAGSKEGLINVMIRAIELRERLINPVAGKTTDIVVIQQRPDP